MKFRSLLAIIYIGLSTTPSFGMSCGKLVSSIALGQPQTLALSKAVLKNTHLPFLSHKGTGPFDTALAMNVQYGPVQRIREQLNKALSIELKFFTGWAVEGEAHVTTVTPPEYSQVLKNYISIERIEQIALENHIQSTELNILGLGRGQKEIQGKIEETYFLITEPENLRIIRRQIYHEFIKNGGDPKAWDPDNFYPHVTVGYTLRDLHDSDGVLKDVEHSFDSRFEVQLAD